MAFSVHIDQFDGPLDLLLQLIESDKLEITDVSLARVTEPFVEHLQAHRKEIPLDELADFLLIAAKLLYLKSRALLPTDDDPLLADGPDLVTQLRVYQAFVEAAQKIGQMWQRGAESFSRSRRPQRAITQGFFPPRGLATDDLRDSYQLLLRRLEPLRRLAQSTLHRVVTLEEKILELHARVKGQMRTSFGRVLSEARDAHERVVTFLALLELLKQRQVHAEQTKLFEDIQLSPLE